MRPHSRSWLAISVRLANQGTYRCERRRGGTGRFWGIRRLRSTPEDALLPPVQHPPTRFLYTLVLLNEDLYAEMSHSTNVVWKRLIFNRLLPPTPRCNIPGLFYFSECRLFYYLVEQISGLFIIYGIFSSAISGGDRIIFFRFFFFKSMNFSECFLLFGNIAWRKLVCVSFFFFFFFLLEHL